MSIDRKAILTFNRETGNSAATTGDGWRKYQPHPNAQGVMATQSDHPFEVHTTCGKLTGKPGDFLIKNFQDRETAYPADVWIVDQTLFRQSYKSVVPGK